MGKKKNIHLLIIDPQNDFCHPQGALYVNNACYDMQRLESFIRKYRDDISYIHVSLDSHRMINIAHPIFWINEEGKHPSPFTIITKEDYNNGKWQTYNPSWKVWAKTYLEELERNNKYKLCIWPPHCIIGTWGHAIVKNVSDALIHWEMSIAQKTNTMVNYIAKGSNSFTEHYSIYKAEVIIPEDESTLPNTGLKSSLMGADTIFISGEALSHCVANTVRDLCNSLGEDNIKKIVLLIDQMSSVTGFEKIANNFLLEMKERGVRQIHGIQTDNYSVSLQEI